MARPRVPVAARLALLAALGCGAPQGEPAPGSQPPEAALDPGPVRLADRYEPGMLQDRVEVDAGSIPRSEWRFAGLAGADLGGWRAVAGVEDLRLEAGALAGRAADATPLIAAERTTPIGPDDRIHAVEVRARVSAGTELRVRLVDAVAGDPEEARRQAGDLLLASSVPLRPGEEMRTYSVPAPLAFVGGEATRHLLVQPTDAAGADFAIESIRAILVDEHLASLPSGAGWHHLGEIYHASLALRPGESIQVSADVPRQAAFFVELGSLRPGAARFRVELARPEGPPATLLERTVTTPGRWERARVDLAEHAGSGATLVFSLDSDHPGALGFFGSPVLRGPDAPAPGLPRAVVLLLVDTLRRDHLEAWGYERRTAPQLARRAAEGALFADAVAQGSWTKVSTPSLVTGLYQSSHGVTDFDGRLPDAAVTLAEVFRDAGYATVGYSSVFFTGRFSNMHQGYESFHELGSLADNSTKTARAYVDRLLGWIDDHPQVPFFAFLHVFDPHDPFEPRSPYDALFADPARREQHLRETEASRPFIAWPFMKQRGLANPEELRKAGVDPVAHVDYNRDWYDGSIRAMDAELARVFERLGELGDALLVFTSDHGEEFHEHGSVFHGETAYGEMIDVPLVFWGPGRVPAGARVEATVQSIDVAPTLLELAGLPALEATQGASLVPLMRGGEWSPRPAVAEAFNPDEVSPSPRQGWDAVAIVSQGWKLVHNVRRPEGVPEFELYHRERDPLDSLDVAASFPVEVERLRGELEAWHSGVGAIRLEPDAAAGELSPDEAARLRELGYGN